MELSKKKCVPCEGGVPRLTRAELDLLLPQIPAWKVEDERRIVRRFLFEDFKGALAFVNDIAALAESEGHHPDFTVRYSVVDVVLYTHAIGGLSENDLVLAAKIDELPSARGAST